ncbi:spliceosome-associated protein 49 [Ophiocordyceps camponoti-floridani]|uniref:Spliceosome-associated protein 49 n=1 Tax=Ophiocordyceps camponoti-floridani TaxID=2030778 RepID=A0A8H4QCJ1_9HYPO|nr:spliceosome-associated protein 49 [Ophiocordyceps camponoti-floridani]
MAQNRHWEQDKEATVYIGNIDERAPPAMIYEIMLQMGPIQNIHMPRDRVTQNHQGFGFVEFRGPEDADYAAQVMNGIKLYGKPLRVNKASADKQKSADVGAELFVGNLDHMVDEKILYDTFSRFGPLLSLPKVARDDDGASKGFGFVSFADFDSSDSAITDLNGQYILSKEISVQYAFKKDGRGERHGDAAERQLAAQAKLRNIVPEAQPIPQAYLNPPQAQAQPVQPSAPAAAAPNSVPPPGFEPLAPRLSTTACPAASPRRPPSPSQPPPSTAPALPCSTASAIPRRLLPWVPDAFPPPAAARAYGTASSSAPRPAWPQQPC